MEYFTKTYYGNLIDKLYSVFITVKPWKEIEYFSEKWKERIREMSKYIYPNSSILDLGCGRMWLKEFIGDCNYYPVDYRDRGLDCIVCDFNKKEFPDLITDIIFVSGCLEYISDYKWFIQKMTSHSRDLIIVSYCTLGVTPKLTERKKLSWQNHLSEKALLSLFQGNNFFLIEKSISNNNPIFVFRKS